MDGCLSAPIEAACKKCVRMEVSNTKALAHVLDEMGTDYKIITDETADVYAKVNISQLTAVKRYASRLGTPIFQTPRVGIAANAPISQMNIISNVAVNEVIRLAR